MRWAMWAASLLGCAGWAAPASAEWTAIQQVTQGTAQTMEQSTFSIGIFAPLMAGMTNRLTVMTHPILDLLLVPNVALRYRLVDHPRFALALTTEFKRSLSQTAAASALVGAEPGDLIAGAIVSWWASPKFSLTGGAYYASHFDEQQPNSDRVVGFAQGVAVSMGGHWLPRPTDLLQASTAIRYGFATGDLDKVVVGATWTHDTRDWLGGVHWVVHLTWNDQIAGLKGQLSFVNRWPVIPTLDLWWRL